MVFFDERVGICYICVFEGVWFFIVSVLIEGCDYLLGNGNEGEGYVYY